MAQGARETARPLLLETLLWSIVGVLGVLVILDGLSDLIDGLGDLSDTYGFSDLLIYIALTLPRRVEEFVPYATLIGALFGLGRLASSSELTIIRSAGVSMPRLAWMAVKPALIVALAGFGVGEYVAPSRNKLRSVNVRWRSVMILIWPADTAHGTGMAVHLSMSMRCNAEV